MVMRMRNRKGIVGGVVNDTGVSNGVVSRVDKSVVNGGVSSGGVVLADRTVVR
jgi:hypothetical protein